MTDTPDIIYTKVDEAPSLPAPRSLPIIQKFADAAGVSAWAPRISRWPAASWPSFPSADLRQQRIPDDLAILGELVKTPRPT
jgi:isocitrate dehydrogenase